MNKNEILKDKLKNKPTGSIGRSHSANHSHSKDVTLTIESIIQIARGKQTHKNADVDEHSIASSTHFTMVNGFGNHRKLVTNARGCCCCKPIAAVIITMTGLLFIIVFAAIFFAECKCIS